MIELLKKEIEPLRKSLLSHPLYNNLENLEQINIFMKAHVYAVWDFMSLLKALQQQLTCVSIPWVPTASPTTRRLINEIVLAEETDVDQDGKPASHYELYLDAMEQSGADTTEIVSLIKAIESDKTLEVILAEENVADPIKSFLKFTFDLVATKQPHKIAAAFTFGREDLIPDLFTAIVTELSKDHPEQLDKFVYYLNRHIELDGDEHGPMAELMISELCGNEEQKWLDAIAVTKQALTVRIELWDYINQQILIQQPAFA